MQEFNGPKDEDYIFNIGYTQTAMPVLAATAPAEYTGKTGYYGKQGTYFIPTSTYRDHPIFHDMKNHNIKFNYTKGLVHTNLADDIVKDEESKWNMNRELRTLSRNFTSLTKEELEDRALRKTMKGSRSLAKFNPHTDLLPSDQLDPYDPAMRASAYNPFGKLLGKPHLKTPRRLDNEFIQRVESKQGLRSSYEIPNSRITTFDYANPPRTFHDQQIQKAMYLGTPGQRFTYAALNSEVENSIVQSHLPAVQPFHMRTSMSKIPTTRMSTSFLPTASGKSGFVTSAYNPMGVKPTSRLQPVSEGIFEKETGTRRGPLPISVLNEPSAIYILHYVNRLEE